MRGLQDLLIFAVFPGFIFTAFFGGIAAWVDRKVTARIHFRVGPPWYQTFADVVKLLGKETTVPRGASRWLFLAAPMAALAAAAYAGALVFSSYLAASWKLEFFRIGFGGDIFVAVYVLTIPSIALVIGAMAARNPLSTLGAGREIQLLVAYELPFWLAVAVPLMKSGGRIGLAEIVSYQMATGSTVASASGIIGFIVAILALQAKLGIVPFDIAEAETEIMSGPFIEYSGSSLALFKLARAMLLVVAPALIVLLYWASPPWYGLGLALKVFAILAVAVLLKNTNPRVRLDQAVRFFWGPVTLAAVAAVVLAALGY
ncbi:MAG: NADH-quinone oxidoreductase subunit H [Planctomycetes bacterium]|nr:NADH-quinone oxidoreductase subunit H [Planctomycetota bacterium]